MGTMSTVASHTLKPHHLSLPDSLHFLSQLSEECTMTTSLQHERLRSRTCVLPPHISCAFLYRHTPKLLPCCCCHWSALAQPHKPFERHLKTKKNKLRIAMHGVDWVVSGEEWLRKHHCWGQTILWNYIVHRTCSISFGSMLCFNPSKRMFVPGRRQKKPLHFGEAVFLHLTWLASKTTLRLIEPLPLFPL